MSHPTQLDFDAKGQFVHALTTSAPPRRSAPSWALTAVSTTTVLLTACVPAAPAARTPPPAPAAADCAASTPAPPAPPPQPAPPPAAASPAPAPAAGPIDRYRAAVLDTQFPERAGVVNNLLTLVKDTPGLIWKGSRVLMFTWTKAQYYKDPKYKPGFAFPLYGDTWFTAGTQVRDVCSKGDLRGAELARRLEQLLGLPPDSSKDAFLEVWVEPKTAFRPCADPDVTHPSCPIQAPLTLPTPESERAGWSCPAPCTGVGCKPPAEHTTWLCVNWANTYGKPSTEKGFPWTALGYTYDWSSPERPVGPSEFVVRGQTQVVFERLLPTEEFCRGGAEAKATTPGG